MEPRRVRKIVGGPLEPSWEIAPLGDEFPGKVYNYPGNHWKRRITSLISRHQRNQDSLYAISRLKIKN